MAIIRPLTIRDEAYEQLKAVKGTLSYSEVIILLVREHHELSKLKLEAERLAPV